MEIFVGILILILAILAGLVNASTKKSGRSRTIRDDRASSTPVDSTAGVRVTASFTTSEGKAPERRRRRPKDPVSPVGRLTYQKPYRVRLNAYGEHPTACRICQATGHPVLAETIDSAENAIRCCMRCLRKYGGDGELTRATEDSAYVGRVVECLDALDILYGEFPDPSRRPYGEVSLLRELEWPFFGYSGIERVIQKINKRAWTEYDLARIEGRPEPGGDAEEDSPTG